MPYSTSSGSELVSIRATTGDVQALSSLMAFSSRLVSMTKRAWGRPFMSRAPPRLVWSLVSSFAEHSLLLLGQNSHAAVLDHGLELLHAVDAGADGDEVGQHTAEPTLVDVRHVGALSSVLDGLLSLLLGADEQHVATLGDVLTKV